MFGFAKRFWSFGFWSYDLGIGRTVTATASLSHDPKIFFWFRKKKEERSSFDSSEVKYWFILCYCYIREIFW